MELVRVAVDSLVIDPQLLRSRRSKSFSDRLYASLSAMGLAEPLKVAQLPRGQHLLIDGHLRLECIQRVRSNDPTMFSQVPVYLFDYEQRFEIRFQSDIYQDLLPSQLASLVEHLHQSEHVMKSDIARYIGVSPATLRNYTGLWRLIQRGGLFGKIVNLMDAGVIPASNPYAWLRLTHGGIATVFERESGLDTTGDWVARLLDDAQQGRGLRYTTAVVEQMTGSLPSACYREAADKRSLKQQLGLRRSRQTSDAAEATRRLQHARTVLERASESASNATISSAAASFKEYLR